ncbi:DUF4843 domain-containing protein [Gabonibacter chumensis]|uniref:DUF4843 domain-containing protein n=1 Tax=Gabonibacter chumensis TaxID=2972474 RepID=UPI0025741370|nr:DUF4843 domain-containing protein [Gabonibacter chumensis]MCR9013146.1 DUF4843 domain-containing protein [Gabonibacter chumensis]
MKKYISICLILTAILWACNTEEVPLYETQRYLFFPDSAKGLDSCYFSFSHYPGKTEKEVTFYVALTGDTLAEPLEYKLRVVDTLTTALPQDYVLPTRLTFAAGKTIDVLKITCKNTREELKTQKVYVTFVLEPNENFKPSLYNQQKIRIIFDNISSAPLWWSGELERYVLGEYSPKKFECFILANEGLNDLTGMSLSEAREYAMKLKQYCIDNNIMEEDNKTPMVDGIPVY